MCVWQIALRTHTHTHAHTVSHTHTHDTHTHTHTRTHTYEHKVDGKAVDGFDVESVFKMIRGLQNTDVLLELGRGTNDEIIFSVTLPRKPHKPQPPKV